MSIFPNSAVLALVSLAVLACSESPSPSSKKDSPLSITGELQSAADVKTAPQSYTALMTLNDTGITYGGDYPQGVNDECTGLVDPNHHWAQAETFSVLKYSGQDCESGRDKTHPDDSDGYAGLSYLKISDKGVVLDHQAQAWSCVLDRVSGLMWEVKQQGNQVKGDGGLHDADDVYSWYSNNWDSNGNSVGNWGRHNDLCSGYVDGESSTYCNTESFVNRVNSKSLCSFTDWRLPTVAELNSLVYFGATEPAIDRRFFPNTQGAPYWTSSLIADSSEQARYVNFRFGQSVWSPKLEFYRVRLVRQIDGRQINGRQIDSRQVDSGHTEGEGAE